MGGESAMTEYGRIAGHFQCEKLHGICVDKSGIQTGPFGSLLHKEDYADIGTPIITVEHLLENRISHIDTPFVTDEDKKRLTKFSLSAGDIVFSRVGSVDRRSLVRDEEDGWLFSGRCLRVRVDKQKIDPVYLSYFFGHEGFKNHIRSIAVGATMPSINTKILSDIRIYYPPLEEQKSIAQILGTLDDKIDLNRQTNETLEKMAQALFKSWFVDFDPVIDNALAAGNTIPDELQDRAERRQRQRAKPDHQPLPDAIRQLFPSEFELTEEVGWVPMGWEVNNVEAIVRRLKAGKRYAKKEVSSYGQVPVYEQGQSILLGYHNDDANFLASLKDPVFIFGDHTCVTKLGVEPFSISANVIPLKGDKRNTYWTYFAVKDLQNFEEYRRHWMEFAVKPVITPSVQVADLFAGMIRSYLEKNSVVAKNSNTLERLRDTLLPKLISGELRLPSDASADAEQQLANATS